MPLQLAIPAVSAAAIGLEIVLMRLFSVAYWHHFAYMIISLALLGFGASGTVLALGRAWFLPRAVRAFAGFAALFGAAVPLTYLAARALPLNPVELVWDPRQPLYLVAQYALLAVPFFGAGACICLAFMALAGATHRVYGLDLGGAGLGAAATMALLYRLHPHQVLPLLAALAFLAAGLAAWDRRAGLPRPVALAALALAVGAALLPAGGLAPRMSPYKALSQALLVPGARVAAERTSPLGLITAVESPRVPFRDAPGLSLTARAAPPEQVGVFTDGEGMSPITRFDGDPAPLAYLDQVTWALPYHLARPRRVLVLGAGGGADVLQALTHGVPRVDAVELNPQVAALVRDRYRDFSGDLYRRPGVRLHVAEARAFLARPGPPYDLIQLSLVDSFSASAAGLLALSESPLYTVEAFRADLARLAPGGLLAVTRWLSVPPRDGLKLFATAVRALRDAGVADPAGRLALVRSWQTVTLLVRNGPFCPAQVEALRRFCRERGFDVAYFPGMAPGEANRYSVVTRPDLADGARALLGPGADAFVARYKFHIAPATDDAPYFHRFFRWRTLPELLALKGRGGMPLLEWGYPVLVATLLQAVAAGAALVALPLLLRRRAAAPGAGRGRTGLYFLALGLAFMFVEIGFMQRFVLFLGHPVLAAAAVLAGFLVFAGAGALASARAAARLRGRPGPVPAAALGIGALVLLYIAVLPGLFGAAAGLPAWARLAVAEALIAPLAFAMGFPFPLGLAHVQRAAPGEVPWAWAVNGCASVVGAALAALLAIHLGFDRLLLLAALLYAAAGWLFRGAGGSPARAP